MACLKKNVKNNRKKEIFIYFLNFSIIFYSVIAYTIEMITGFKIVFFYEFILLFILLLLNIKLAHSINSLIYLSFLIILTFITFLLNDTSDFLTSIRQIRFYLVGYLTFHLVSNLHYKEKMLTVLNFSILITLFLTTAVLIRQYLFGWTHYEQRWIAFELNRNIDKISDTRYFSTFPSANNASLFFAVSFIVSFWQQNKSIFFKIGVFVSIISILLTQMKVGYFVIILVIIFYLDNKNTYKLILTGFLGTIIVGLEQILNYLGNDQFLYTMNLFEGYGISGLVIKAFNARLSQISINFNYQMESITRVIFGLGFGPNTAIVYIDNLYYDLIYHGGLILIIIISIISIKNFRTIIRVNNKDRKFIIMFFLIHIIYSFSSNALNSVGSFYIFILYCATFSRSNNQLGRLENKQIKPIVIKSVNTIRNY